MTRPWRVVLMAASALTAVGCVDQHEPTASASDGPDYAIADAATGWNPAFYWLPPIVPPYAPSGDFDATSAPIVRICEWSGSSCARQVAEYSLTGGTGGERVTVDLLAEHYQVMWRTGSPSVQPLVVGGTYRITVALDGQDAGFADARLVGTRRQAQAFAIPGYVPVVAGSNFKIKFRIETLTQLLDLYIDHKADGPLGQELGSGARTYNLTMTSLASGALQAVYSDGFAAGTFSGERRFARSNPVLRMVYSDADYFAAWAGRQNSDNSVEGAWFDAAGQTGDFRLVGQGEPVGRSDDAEPRMLPGQHTAAEASDLDGEWNLDFDRTYDGVYVPDPGGNNTLAFAAQNATDLTAAYTDGNSGAFRGALHTARATSVITLLFTNTDYFAAFVGAMTDQNTIVGVYFDAAGYAGDFVLNRRYYREDFNGTSVPPGWQATGGTWSVESGQLSGSFAVVGVDDQLTRTNAAGIPKTIRARVLNTPGAPQGAAGVAFNWTSSTEFYAIELRTNNPALSADIVRIGASGTQILASCPNGLAYTDTWYILELVDTPAGLLGRLLDQAGTPTSCTMLVPGAHVTNPEVGLVVYSGGGLVKADWIETDMQAGVVPPVISWCNTAFDFSAPGLAPGWALVEYGTGPFIADGRLQSPTHSIAGANAPRIDALGPVDVGTTEIVVEYDANVDPSGDVGSRGLGRLVGLMTSSGWSYEAQEGIDRYGANVHSFRAQRSVPPWPDASTNYAIFDLALTSGVQYGTEYHFRAVLQDGQVTWSASQNGGAGSLGPFVQPLTDFVLSDVRGFWFGVNAGLAGPAWADNLSVTCQ